MKQERQNAFLASPTLLPLEGFHADTRLLLKNSTNLKLDISMIYVNWLESGKKKFSKETNELIQFMVNSYLEKIDLGMEDGLTKLEQYSITVWLNSSKYEDPGLFNASFEMVFPLSISKHAYYGLINDGYKFNICLKYTRRPKRKYHERYIGVGYKDKGTTSIDHLDGSPNWGIIASCEKHYIESCKAQMLVNRRKDVARESRLYDLTIKSKWRDKGHNLCTEQRIYYFKSVKDNHNTTIGYLLIDKAPKSGRMKIELRDHKAILAQVSVPWLLIGRDCLIMRNLNEQSTLKMQLH